MIINLVTLFDFQRKINYICQMKAVYINLTNPAKFEAIDYINHFNEVFFAIYMSSLYVSPYNALIERYEKNKRILLN